MNKGTPADPLREAFEGCFGGNDPRLLERGASGTAELPADLMSEWAENVEIGRRLFSGHLTESAGKSPEAVGDDRVGWRYVRVNAGFEGLMRALARAHDKGYMPDAIADDYEGFDYEL